jgi:hypothetical protein
LFPSLSVSVLKPFIPYIVIALLVLSFGGWCWTKGANHAEAKYTAIISKEQANALKEVERLARKASEITLVYLARRGEIEEKIRTVKVTNYVTKESDAKCPIPVGFVRLWNDSDGTPKALYQPSSSIDDPATGVALSDIGESIKEARRRFEVNKLQCEKLQEWLKPE